MESIHNFRDFGGYRTSNGSMVRPGLLYRSASLANVSENDLKKLSSLGIKTIIDLRTHREKNNHADRIPDNCSIATTHIPIKATRHDESAFIWQLLSLLFGKARKLDFHQVMTEVYQEYVTGFRTEFSAIIRLAADSRNLPVLIHCVGGKDRTGLACSLIHLVLGVPAETVMQDYLLTNDFFHEIKDEFRKRLKKFALFGVSLKKLLPLFEARREYLEAAFEQIRHDYGTVENFIREGLNFSDEDRLDLKELLLEK